MLPPSLYPLLGATTGITTILTCYHLTFTSHHFPPGVTTPPISLLGCRSPERIIYQIGFATTGLLLLRCILVEYTKFVHPHWKTHCNFQKGANVAYIGGILASIGCIGQGIVTLEHDFVRKATGGMRPGESLDKSSLWHQILALVFFVGAAMHCYCVVYMMISVWITDLGGKQRQRGRMRDSTTNDGEVSNISEEVDEKEMAGNAITTPTSTSSESGAETETETETNNATTNNFNLFGKTSILLKILCTITTFISWPIAEMLHPLVTATAATRPSVRSIDLGGLAQYVTIISYVLFFGSYTLDLREIEKQYFGSDEEGVGDRVARTSDDCQKKED